MQKRTLKVAILAVLTIALILGLASVAAAQPSQWPDLAGSVVGPYNVTIDQVSSISNGFPNGMWMPYQDVTRAQFVKLADAALKIDLVNRGHTVLHGRPQDQHVLWLHPRRRSGWHDQRGHRHHLRA